MPFDLQSELGQVTGLGSCGGIDEACDGGAVAVVASMKLVMVVGGCGGGIDETYDGGAVAVVALILLMVGQLWRWHR